MNDIPSCQRLQFFVKQLIDSEEGTSALEEKLRQIVNTINLRENSILKNKVKQQARMRMPDIKKQRIHPTTSSSREKLLPGALSGSKSLERNRSQQRNVGQSPELINIDTYNKHPMIVKNLSPLNTNAGQKHSQKVTAEGSISPKIHPI